MSDTFTVGTFNKEGAGKFKLVQTVVSQMQERGFRYVGTGGTKITFDTDLPSNGSALDLCFTQEPETKSPLQQVLWIEIPVEVLLEAEQKTIGVIQEISELGIIIEGRLSLTKLLCS